MYKIKGYVFLADGQRWTFSEGLPAINNWEEAIKLIKELREDKTFNFRGCLYTLVEV